MARQREHPNPRDTVHHNAAAAGSSETAGTLSMARLLTDPAIEAEIQALAAEAPLPTPDQAARLARLLRLRPVRHHDAA